MQPHERLLNNRTFKAFEGSVNETPTGRGNIGNLLANPAALALAQSVEGRSFEMNSS